MAARSRGLRAWFLISISSNFIALTISLLNLEELKNIKYGMEISGTPVLLKETPELSNTLTLSSKHGQQYQCILPAIETEDHFKEERKNFTTEEITKLLAPLTKRCLYHTNGWWTYEVCFGKSISQYHEEGNIVVGARLSLGTYSSETEWEKENIEETKSKSVVAVKRFHSQSYKNGSKCDLSGEPRQTQIKIFCEEDKADYVYRVDEPSSCSYIIQVHTSKLCKHPLFRPLPTPKAKAIQCSPALSQEKYDSYLAAIERKKKEEEARQIAKLKRLEEERAARKRKQLENDEQDFLSDYQDVFNRKGKPIRSQLWPWESPGVENDDEVWIDGNINAKKMEVTRMDIVKNSKKMDDEKKEEDGTMLFMSRGIRRGRQQQAAASKPGVPSKEADSRPLESEQQAAPDGSTAEKREQVDQTSEQDKPGKTDPTVPEKAVEKPEKTDDSSVAKSVDAKSTETKEKVSQEEEAESEGIGKKKSEDILEGEETGEKSLEEEWKDAMTKVRMQLRSVVRKQLQDMGVDPDELESKLKVMMGGNKDAKEKAKTETKEPLTKEEKTKDESSADTKSDDLGNKDESLPSTKPESSAEEEKLPTGEDIKPKDDAKPTVGDERDDTAKEVGPGAVGLKAAVNAKMKKLLSDVEEKENVGQLQKDSKEKRMLLNLKKLIDGMDHQNMLLMKKEESLRRALENHFDELGDRFSLEAAMMKKFIDDIEESGADDRELQSEDDYLRDLVDRLKGSVSRFDRATSELTKDMKAVKDLNKEVHSKIDGIISKEKTKDANFFRLAAKANLLLRQLLQRSAQLDREMRVIREISREAVARKEDFLDEQDEMADSKKVKLKGEAKARMDSIVERLKTMIQDIDTGRKEQGDKIGESVVDAVASQLLDDDRIKVRVSKIKGDDGDPVWSEKEDERGVEGEAMTLETKLKRASKRMENIVKEQLKSAGVAPAGKVRVKIITSKEALENFGGGKGMQILSEEETDQFKKMVMNLLGGNEEATTERKRQTELENNYNLVWNENQFSKARGTEDDDEPEAEVTFDETDFL